MCDFGKTITMPVMELDCYWGLGAGHEIALGKWQEKTFALAVGCVPGTVRHGGLGVI